MLQAIVVGILFVLALFLEGTYLSIPFLVIAVVLGAVMIRSKRIVFGTFLLGLFFDILTFQRLGQTSLFLLATVVIILLYDRKFDTRSVPFVFFVSVLASTVYLVIFGSYSFIVQMAVTVFFTTALFFLFNRLHIVKKEANEV